MITDTIVRIVKSPSISKSWLAHNRLAQRGFILYLRFFNLLATRTNFTGKRLRGSQGTGNTISPSAFIEHGSVVIGDNCRIGCRAVLERNSRLGNRVCIGPGTIVASEGFEVRRVGETLVPVAHTGGVTIHDDTVIGSYTCIDKSVYGDDTEIGRGTRIGNFVHVAHGVKIGDSCSIGVSAMIGGKVAIGDNVIIGNRAIISDQIDIGDGAQISPGAVVTKDILPGRKVTGNFAISHDRFMEFHEGIR